MAEFSFIYDVVFNSEAGYTNTTGAPVTKPKTLVTPQQAEPEKTSVGDIEISNWGSCNDFPSKADGIINSVEVLNSGLIDTMKNNL